LGKILVTLSDDLEHQLRVRIAELGGKKGAISETVEAAIKLWLRSKSK
jgi:hypothetical protein